MEVTDGDERLAMDDDDCMGILWSLHQRRIEFNQLEESIQATEEAADELEEQLVATNFTVAALLAQRFTRIPREREMYVRSGRWFEETLPRLGEQHFRACFRVSSTTFRYLVDVCRSSMQRQDTAMKTAITVEKRVAISLYRLCSTAEERTIGHLFAVGQSVVNESYREFCDVVIEELEARTVSMIRNEDLEHHMREFQAVLGFPNDIGALDGCHLPVSPLKDSAVDYRNYKGCYSVILLALVDHRYLFRYISVGSPGKCHDANVYGRSPLGRLLEDYQVAVPRSIGGTKIPPIVLCDQAFPLTRNLMKPFPHSFNHPQDEGDYNYALSKARRVVENAFGRLKARFRIVLKRMEVRIDNVYTVVRACCILHNVCETLNDSADKQWIQDARKVEDDDKLEQPSRKTKAKTDSGTAVRTALVAYFGANPPPKRN
ncbi:protein ANTAGONIST OF LIKE HETEROCHROMATIN PROTEIN 1 [Ixodes scapularis]